MDDYFLECSKEEIRLEYKDLYLIGIACILLASKLEDTKSLSLDYAQVKLGHNKFSHYQILQMEKEILHKLSFRLRIRTPYDESQIKLRILTN